MKKQIVSLCFFAVSLIALAGVSAQNERLNSILISGATLVDGSGAPRRVVDVRIAGDTIKEIGRLKPQPDERVIDAKGLIIAPGFVDIHNHSDRGFANDPTAKSQILQGITTIAIGPDGGSPWPIGEYLEQYEKQRLSTNIIAFVGHATVRQRVMGQDFKRAATEAEIAKMAEMVEQAMREGAVGISTGLEYDVGHPSATEEVIALSRVAAKYKGIYMSHVRDEADLAFDAFREAIRIGREARLPVQISHIKLGVVGVWGKAREVVKMVEDARRGGLDITADCYPYDAWASTITVLVPSRRHDDPGAVKKGLDDVGGGVNVLITNCAAHRDYEGRTLDEIAKAQNKTAVDVYIQIVKDGGAGVVCKSMTEPDIKTFYQQPWVMVASDGGIGMRHPRGAGTFPRVLGRYVREWKWLTLEEAVRKMSAFPAWRLGLRDRGLIKAGMKADLTIFDPKKVNDQSTMIQPALEPVGVMNVFVNGIAVVDGGKVTNERAGEVLRHAPTDGAKSK
ncbi:MAG: N-acyl-D-amino-acid deacylase family protein [Blastocatellia bacterium]